jgi:hypothetical protein
MPPEKTWPWVRCQIPPDAHRVAWQVAAALGWTVPAVYMACICYCLLEIEPASFISCLRESLAALDAKESDRGEL